MTDPYQVLGVARGASDEDIKKAYRNLSRRYHPDANVNNPNKAQAEERFKEVQQAYDQIMKEKQQGTSGSYAGYGAQGARTQQGPFGGYSYGNSTYRSAEENLSPKMRAVLNYIRSGSYEEALHVLQDMPSNERNGRWYFYSAQAFQGLGNTAMAMDHIRQAVALEPSNMEYRQFQQQMQNGGEWYSNMGNAYRRPYGNYAGGCGGVCMSLLLMELVCGCCCRPF